MNTLAVVLEAAGATRAEPARPLTPPGDEDVVVEIEWSGISTGTERLLWSGRMPPFPGMGYPLVPGYESVGRVVRRPAPASGRAGRRPRVRARRALLRRGARPVRRRRLAARRARRARRRRSTSASASRASCSRWPRPRYHAIAGAGARQPDLIVGHGVLGRLLARLAVVAGGEPPIGLGDAIPSARGGAAGYRGASIPDEDARRDYRAHLRRRAATRRCSTR